MKEGDQTRLKRGAHDAPHVWKLLVLIFSFVVSRLLAARRRPDLSQVRSVCLVRRVRRENSISRTSSVIITRSPSLFTCSSKSSFIRTAK